MVQAFEQVSGRVGLTTPVVRHLTEPELRLYLSRVRGPSPTDEVEHLLRTACGRFVPGPPGRARVQQGHVSAREETVVDEVVLLDGQARIPPLQIACGVPRDAVPQDQILGPGRCADRIGLHEAQPVNGAGQGGRGEEGAGDRVAAESVEGEWRAAVRGGHGGVFVSKRLFER